MRWDVMSMRFLPGVNSQSLLTEAIDRPPGFQERLIASCKLQVAIFDRPRSAIYIIHLDIDYINHNSFEV
jgi:hypothetical protein